MKKGEGDCFSMAGRMVNDNPLFTLCHAKVMGQGKLKGKRIWHAWCEHQDVVFDNSNGRRVVTRKEIYYKIAKIKEDDVKRYSHIEALKMLLKHEYFGVYPDENH